MKQSKLFLSFVLAIPLLVSCGSNDTPFPLSGDVIKHPFVTSSMLINARFPSNSPDSLIGKEEEGFGVKWTEDTWDFQNDIDDTYSSFARMVVEAPFSGEYTLKLHAKTFNQSYPVRVYVNSKKVDDAQDITISDPSYAWGTDERDSDNFNVNLKKGKNVLLFQVIRWGCLTSLSLPKECNVVSYVGTDNDNGVYTSKYFIYQNLRNEANSNYIDPKKEEIDYQALKYDANPSFEPSAILHFNPKNSTKSLDVTYKVIEKDEGSAELALSLGSDGVNKIPLDVSDASLNKENTIHIPSYQLNELGFNVSSKQNIRLAANLGRIKVLKIQESTQEDRTPQSITLNVDELKENVLIRGRNIASNSYIGLDWTSSGIEFNITGGGDIAMNLQEVNDYFGASGSASGGTRFAVEIDGRFTKYIVPSNQAIIASNLSASKHHVAIYKTSEASGGLVNLLSMKISDEAEISKPIKDYKFEILGDSITCGNQISKTEENGYLAYTTQLAKSYNANLNVVSVSGRGLKLGYNGETGWNASWDNQINTLWTETSFFRDGGTSKWDTSKYQPDVVIANLGNNDLGDWVMSIAPMTITQFTDEVISFSNKLRAAYPSAKIIWTYGAFVNRKFESEYRNAVQSLNDNNIQFVYLEQMNGGADDHPNAEQHQIIANVLSSKIAEMLGVNDPRA